MATWTELLSGALVAGERGECYGVHWTALNAKGEAEEMREMLLDLPHHPNIHRVTGVIVLTGDDPAAATIPPGGLLLVCKGGRMSSGASGPITPGAGVQRDTVQPWRVTPVLGDAGTAPPPLIIAPSPGTWPATLDGAAWPPKVETVTDKPLIILGDK